MIKQLYSISLAGKGKRCRIFFIIPILWLVFVLIVSMCSDQDIVWFIITPKYLHESDLSVAVEFTLRNVINQFKLPWAAKNYEIAFRNT